MLRDFAMFDAEAALMQEQALKDGRKLTREDVALLIDIAKQRQSLIEQMKDRLLSGDEPDALRLARQICGLPAEVTE
jgi:hypothetical protein